MFECYSCWFESWWNEMLKVAALKCRYRMHIKFLNHWLGLDEEECSNFKHAGRHGGDRLATWVKAELQLLLLLSREVAPFGMQDVGSHFLKVCEMRFSLKELFFKWRLKIDFKETNVSFVLFFLGEWIFYLL